MDAKFPGFQSDLGTDRTWTIPALSLGQLRKGVVEKLAKHDELIEAGKTYEAIALRGEIILAALQRNYPDFDEDLLFDWLDLQNSTPIWLSVLGLSGLTPGEAPAAERKPETDGTSNPSTGA